MRRAVLPLIAFAICALAGSADAMVRLAVYVDHSARLPVASPIGSVIVGDPAVADVLVTDRHTVYVQGKSYGMTEVVVLDPEGRTLWSGDVAVTPSDLGRVSVVRGPSGGQGGGAAVPMGITEMTCAGYCTQSAHGGKTQTASPQPQMPNIISK